VVVCGRTAAEEDVGRCDECTGSGQQKKDDEGDVHASTFLGSH
jgi:hypothetical protein